MNNEPVGYVYSVAGEPIKSAKINPEIPNGTPLYTHPANLTEQDLDKLVKDAEDLKHMEQYIVGLIDGFNHARAILKKASEK